MSDPDRLEFVSGGGCLMLFGLPFFASGLFMIVAPFTGIDMRDEAGNAVEAAGIIPFGLLFALIGGVIMFGRKGVEIDRRHGEVSTWWGLLFPFKKTRHSLDGFEHVAMRSEIRRGKNNSYTVYPVRLVGPTDLGLVEDRRVEESRRRAESIAKFVGLGVMDETLDPPVFREADKLDVSVREQLRDAPPPAPEFSERARALYVHEGARECRVQLPPAGYEPLRVVVLGLMLLFPLVFTLVSLSQFLAPQLSGEQPWTVFQYGAIGIACFGMLMIGIGPIAALVRHATLREELRITPDAVHLTTRWRLWTSEVSIPVDELEEVEVARPSQTNANPLMPQRSRVILRSDRRTLTCGSTLEPSDQEWLRQLIRYVVATGKAPED